SSKIRDNTPIKKWFRTFSQRDATNWENFPDEVSSKDLNEDDFRAFVESYLRKIK
ncbi:SinI family restriction endonuclease, partial [Salmonella enterica subsp. enterica serovar Oranienburg]|nr:SinI family restriction endonuclease [Salmonella enterica]EBV2925799.1 restriction endonuclease [Salmonella enterica subsp. enterica serovar Oranienburg]EDK0963640.1 SinI family restriction endonuclease [Salmonella enterica subsp. enterica serovar Infantis]EHO6899636.1 SinI family restriction endonuclease [Salmonella enterica subsp. enterica serovar Oranienburg]EIP1683906.1 SinI family restriction endonuclease [Salmonella enterica]